MWFIFFKNISFLLSKSIIECIKFDYFEKSVNKFDVSLEIETYKKTYVICILENISKEDKELFFKDSVNILWYIKEDIYSERNTDLKDIISRYYRKI